MAMRRIVAAIRNLFRRETVERDLAAEVRSYADLLEDEKISSGMSSSEAKRAARMSMGGPEQLKEEIRSDRTGAWLETLWQDLRFGANTAIFSVIRGVLLQALPFRDPSRIVLIRGTVGRRPTGSVSYPDYLDARKLSHSFDDVAAYSSGEFIVNGTDRSERVLGEMVSDSYFPILGTTPLIGRTFLPEENQIPGAHPVAV